MQARAAYEQGRREHSLQLASLERRSRGIGAARLVVAATACVVVGGIVWAHLGSAGWGVLALLALGFVVLIVIHSRVHDATERASAGLRFHERGIARLTLAWDALGPSSGRFRDDNHPFTGDLDVFGRASLMQLVNATETRFGEDRLAALLSIESHTGWPHEVAARQEAVRELSPRLAFREAFAVAGASSRTRSRTRPRSWPGPSGPAALLRRGCGGSPSSPGSSPSWWSQCFHSGPFWASRRASRRSCASAPSSWGLSQGAASHRCWIRSRRADRR